MRQGTGLRAACVVLLKQREPPAGEGQQHVDAEDGQHNTDLAAVLQRKQPNGIAAVGAVTAVAVAHKSGSTGSPQQLPWMLHTSMPTSC